MALFRVLLAVFGLSVGWLALRFVTTGQRRYLHWALWLLAGALASGVVFFGVLLIARLT